MWNINKTKSYMVLEDILKTADNYLQEISKEIEHNKSTLSDSLKLELESVYRLVELNVMLEQEKTTFYAIYILFS